MGFLIYLELLGFYVDERLTILETGISLADDETS
jgi:hypothetical protein